MLGNPQKSLANRKPHRIPLHPMDMPLPNHAVQPTAPAGQKMVEVIVSTSGKERNYITVDGNGLFRVFEEHWNVFVDEPEEAFWSGHGPTHIVDSLEAAKRYALLGFSDSTPDEIA